MNVAAMKASHTQQVPDDRTTHEKPMWSSSKAKNAFKNKETKHRRVASAVWDEEMASMNERHKRSTSREDQIEKIILTLKEKGKQTDLFGERYEAFQKVACDETQVANLKRFWTNNTIFYVFYLTSAALMASICTCYDVMRKHVTDIVETGSGDDALELLEDMPSLFASVNDLKQSRNKRSILENYAVNPESPENHELKQMQRILAESVTEVNEFSNILFTNTNDSFTISPELEESLDHIILEFDEMSASLYQETVLQRPKRIADSYKTVYYPEPDVKTDISVKHKRNLISPNNENPVILNFPDAKSDSRKRMALSEMDNVVIIQNEKYPCKVLSVCTYTSLCFEDYSEEHLQRFLWIWKDNRLKNLETRKFLYGELYGANISLHEDLNDDDIIHFEDGSLIVGNKTQCSIHAFNDPQLVSIKIVCGKNHQKWSLLSFNTARNNIIAIACLFFIQDINSCLVFTPQKSNGTVYITMEPVADGDGILEQMWQWDGQLIKHYDSQNYLTAIDIGNPVSLTTKEDKSLMQKWTFEDNHFRVTNFQQNLYLSTATGIVFVNETTNKTYVQLYATGTYDIDCNARRLGFVIKHTSKPCTVLCVKEHITKVDMPFRFIIASAGFVVGALFGMLTNLCTNSQRAVKIAISFGVVLFATSVLSFQYTHIFSNDYFTVTFETFDQTNPSKCLWNENTGTIRSLINNQALELEHTIYGRTMVARLVEQSNKMWVLENGSLINSNGFSCDLDLSDNGMKYDQSTALFNFVTEPRVMQSWAKVEYDTNDIYNFMKDVNCMYFLRHFNNKSCSLMSSHRSKSGNTLLSSVENKTILENLWYTSRNLTINAATGISLQHNIRDFEKIPLNNTHSVLSLCPMYFIRSVEFPCKVVTEIQIGNTFKLILQEYDPEKFLNQVWEEVDGFIQNIGTGRRMTGEDVQGIFSENCNWKNDTIECDTTYCMLSGLNQTNIICSYSTDPVKWTKVPFDEVLNVKDEIMCIYFVQNQGPHYSYLTADLSSGEVFLVYMASDVVHNQLWFKVNDRLVHLESGLSLSQDPLTDKITISNVTNVNFSLSFEDSKIAEKFSGEILAGFASVRFVLDQQVLVNGSLFWSFININALEADAENLQREFASRNFFFLKNSINSCKLLTVAYNGEIMFKVFQEDLLENQLWYIENDRLFNVFTGKMLSIRNDEIGLKEVLVFDKTQVIYRHHDKLVHVLNNSHECYVSYDTNGQDSGLSCQHIDSIANSWTLIHYDENSVNIYDLYCLFFIRNKVVPCEFITYIRNKPLKLRPNVQELVNNQLFFWKDENIVHLETGLVLTAMMDRSSSVTLENCLESDTSFQSWMVLGDQIVPSYDNYLALEANIADDGIIVLEKSFSEYTTDKTQKWIIIKADDIVDNVSLTHECTDDETETELRFFIRSTQNRCMVLRVDDLGQSPRFEVFDSEEIDHFLWYKQNDHIINVYSGLALMLDYEDESSQQNVIMWHYFAFAKAQKWSMNISFDHHVKLVHVLNNSHECYVSYDTNGQDSGLSCQHNDSLANSWTLIHYDENSVNISDLYCLFFIRNKVVPCEFITYISNKPLKLRPTIQELVNNQLFLWKDENIVHLETGLLLTAMMDRSSSVTLENYLESETSFQTWRVLGDQIVPSDNKNLALEANITDDGVIVLAKSFSKNTTDKTQQWSIIKADDTFDNASLTHECTGDETETELRFFIRSTQNRCMVLRGDDLGQSPRFEVFDSEEIDHFLWYKQNDHIINVYSGLALMLDYEDESIQQNVIMWHYYAFANAQKWSMNEYKIKSFLKQDCILIPLNTGKKINLANKCGSRLQTDVEAIEYSEDDDFITEITCMFFIKSNAEHCELLTNMNSGEVKTRPFNESNLENQLWLWKGKHLVSVRDNSKLLSNQFQHVKLENENKSLLQTWIYSNLFFKNEFGNNNYLTIGENTGDIIVTTLKEPNALQQWMQIDLKEVKKNPHALDCPQSNSTKPIYIVRSDYDTCPILAALDDNKITAVRYSDSSVKSFRWFKDKKHIINAEKGTCLQLVESNMQGNEVFLRQKYYYEQSQKWSTDGDRIKSQSANHSQYLTYTGSDVLMSNVIPNDQQIWKWYTVNEIEKDDNLLRCSRCYNKKEETAANVISYIPIISLFYNIVRSAIYAGFNCPEVAISSLKDALMDVAFDVIVVLSAGTASAFAYGIKTGLKFGLKAGAKAVKTALKSMIKVSLNSFKSSFSKFVQRGVKKTLKTKIKNISSKPRSMMLSVKQKITTARLRFLDLKSATKNTFAGSFKEGTRKLHSSLKSRLVSFKKQLTVKTFKTRLIDLNNLLAKKAERAIKKSDIITKQKTFLRCRRNPKGCQNIDFSWVWDNKVKLPPLSDETMRDLTKLCRGLEDQSGQFASIGLKRGDDFIYTKDAKIDDLRNANLKPQYKNEMSPETALTKKEAAANVMHTEQHLLENIDNEVKIRCKQATPPCKVVMYTKLSPCDNRLPSKAVTCLEHIREKCSGWFINCATSCVVAFKDYWYNDVFDKSFDENFAALMGMKTLPSGKQATNPELFWGESLNDMKSFIKENLDNIKANRHRLENYLNFREEEIEAFGKNLQEAIDAVKPDNADLNAFWDTLFKLYSGSSEHKQGLIKMRLMVLIRETLNKEAKRRKVTKILNDISEKYEGIKFYQIA